MSVSRGWQHCWKSLFVGVNKVKRFDSLLLYVLRFQNTNTLSHCSQNKTCLTLYKMCILFETIGTNLCEWLRLVYLSYLFLYLGLVSALNAYFYQISDKFSISFYVIPLVYGSSCFSDDSENFFLHYFLSVAPPYSANFFLLVVNI